MLHKELLPKYSNDFVKVYAIPQTEIIGIVGLQYTGGGHYYRYREIPKGEIWVAKEYMQSMEGIYYIYHELFEYNKMSMGIDYESAHILANRMEGKARKEHGDQLHKMIQKELDKTAGTISERSHFNGTLKLHVDSSGAHHAHHHKHIRKESFRNNSLTTVK
jgi:hypothetical protein